MQISSFFNPSKISSFTPFASFLMDVPLSNEIVHYFPPFICVYSDGRIERLSTTGHVSAGIDLSTGVNSKDVIISQETNLSVRVYIPKSTNSTQKLPVLIYFHGGGFVIETTASPTYQNFLNTLVAKSNVLVVSVNYRLAPEHPLPIAYDDSWAAIKWVASHANKDGQETWLNEYGDLTRVFFGGDSAGGNIAHNMGIRAGLENPDGLHLSGIILLHPFFWGKDPIGAESGEHAKLKRATDNLWRLANPRSIGSDDPYINPAMHPFLSELGCTKVLVFVAEKDVVRDRGWNYRKVLGASGWDGEVEVVEAKGEEHVFFLFDRACDNAVAMFNKMSDFIYQSYRKDLI